MRCKITGIKTKVRYKGRPVSAQFLQLAIQWHKEDKAADVSHALELLEKAWHKQWAQAVQEVNKKELKATERIEYVKNVMRKFFGVGNEQAES